MTEKPFVDDPRGTVIAMAPEEYAGMSYLISFPYTRSYINTIREGTFVAVRNFASNTAKRTFSVLELVSVLPRHYALGSSPEEAERAFPGFYDEAAKSARVDWEQEEPTELTTRIRSEAISTGIQLDFAGEAAAPTIQPDHSLPMVGEEAHLLSDDLTNEIVNRGLMDGSVPTIAPCRMVLNDAIQIRLRIDELLRTHFAVFGFTGSGKSNLLSGVINDLLRTESEQVKVVLFDLMSEYTALLVDLLCEVDNACLLAVGQDALPGGDATLAYLRGDNPKLDQAVDGIVRTLLPPKELLARRADFAPSIRWLLENRRIRVLDATADLTSSQVGHELADCLATGNPGSSRVPLLAWIRGRFPDDDYSGVTRELLDRSAHDLAGMRDTGFVPGFGEGGGGAQRRFEAEGAPAGAPVKLSVTAIQAIDQMVAILRRHSGELANPLPANARITTAEFRTQLNTPGSPALFLIQANRDDDLRLTASSLISDVFNIRRVAGQVSPSVLFVFDEADEFMPGNTQTDSYAASRAAVATVARRGRKFGMGVGIATQRIAYLDTSIMAQPHTYFMSKLPRAYDREAMASAFGVTDDMMRKTLRFSKGQWLLMSFDAMGLENVPIPVQFTNANTRVREFLDRPALSRPKPTGASPPHRSPRRP